MLIVIADHNSWSWYADRNLLIINCWDWIGRTEFSWTEYFGTESCWDSIGWDWKILDWKFWDWSVLGLNCLGLNCCGTDVSGTELFWDWNVQDWINLGLNRQDWNVSDWSVGTESGRTDLAQKPYNHSQLVGDWPHIKFFAFSFKVDECVQNLMLNPKIIVKKTSVTESKSLF